MKNQDIIFLQDTIKNSYGARINYIDKFEIKSHKLNLIDIIEEGDYVNGSIVVEILHGDPSVIVENYGEEQILENDIKSIVTKEQFEDIKYEVKNSEYRRSN